MAVQIAVGSKVCIKVLKSPRSTAGRKTLLRVLMKDEHLKKRHEINSRHRRSAIEQRRHAGRPWFVIPKKATPVKAVPGDEATVLATVDVVADLKKLAQYVEISPARA